MKSIAKRLRHIAASLDDDQKVDEIVVADRDHAMQKIVAAHEKYLDKAFEEIEQVFND